MKLTRIAAIGLAGLLTSVALSYPSSATTLEPCDYESDHIGTIVTDVDDGWQSYWSDSPLHLTRVCGDILRVGDAIFSNAAQNDTDWTDTFSDDAFDGFGEFYFTDYNTEEDFIADSWTFDESTVTSAMAFSNADDSFDIAATLNQEGNTLTWSVDTFSEMAPFNDIEYGIRGDLGSDETTTIIQISENVWVTHDDNLEADPVLVWKSVGATLDWNPDPEENDEVWFEWPAGGSAQLQVILVPNVQCYTDELDGDGDPIGADDQDTFDQALDFAVNTVAEDFDAYAGDVIDPFGDPTCGAELADTGVEVAPIGGVAALAILAGTAVAVARRRRA
ncbi:MAG: hypothetical protein RLZZ587_647 [Actinomycetota bacterium]